MDLTTFICNLLYRYDCVIVPGFGGFITNRVCSKIDKNTNTIYPPSKLIIFNSNLKHNDGLLANYIASSENISFEKALEKISLTVNSWKNDLQSSTINIKNLGTLFLNDENQIVFQPSSKVNYLTESFGLSNTQLSAISRYKRKPIETVKKSENSWSIFVKYAAAAVILIAISFAGLNKYNQNKKREILMTQEKVLQEKIQVATFIISNPLPLINLSITKKISKPYHIIAGAYRIKKNAQKKVKQLKAKGFDSTILGINKWGLFQVTYNSYSSRSEAIYNLYEIQETESIDAWFYIKK